ncbi:MAG TPA: glycine betaine ABC transporter substrate-binding protein [Gemmatimonadaceae bacterium]|nr:glycine betaine ABC transporter substrate-binding protein [Gemmatimonadaceae bacterium]
MAGTLGALGMVVAAGLALAQGAPTRQVVVASKPFGESYILCEMFAQLLEARGVRVDRRPGLGATEIAFSALRTDAIDVYPEYTGTGLLAILGDTVRRTPLAAFNHVSTEFHGRYGVRWLPPLGFENTYAISVRRETATRHALRTLSDLARVAPTLRAGFTADFIGRNDGLPGLSRTYGLRFREVRPLLAAVKYQALASGDVDIIDGYSTDGLIARYDLVVLEDDREFFPPYQAAAVVGPALARENAAAIAALTELSGRIDDRFMRSLNRRLEVDGVPVAAVARDALDSLGLVRQAASARAAAAGDRASGRRSFVRTIIDDRAALARRTFRHLVLSATSLVVAALVAIPLGLALERRRSIAEPVVRAVGVLQTIPGIALLAFMIPLLGIGVVPALVALFVYSLYPIVRNTYSGVRDADPPAVSSATALGMTEVQVLRDVRLPLAVPSIMAGVRTAAVLNVGTATLAAFIGAGGLGEPIVTGLALSDASLILSGAIPAALLALLVDVALGICERAVRPRGLA